MTGFSLASSFYFLALLENLSQLLWPHDSQQQRQESRILNVTKMSADNFLSWPAERQSRTLAKLWQDFDLNKTALGKFGTDEADSSSADKDFNVDDDFKSLAIDFRARVHFEQSLSHKKFISKVYEKLGRDFFPAVTPGMIESHDDSKIGSFVEVVGYTDKWVWNGSQDSPAWQAALQHHYQNNPHHPEYHVDERNVKQG